MKIFDQKSRKSRKSDIFAEKFSILSQNFRLKICKNRTSKLSIETENQIVSIILELQKEIIQEWISFICEADQETLETWL